jgi:hypothetical protein
MIGTIRVKNGRSSMVIKGVDAAKVEADLRRVYGPMIEAGKRRADRIHAAMLLTWPILTGTSRTSFHPYILLDPAKYRLEVGYRSEDPSVRYIKTTKQGRKRDQTRLRSPMQSDLIAPMKEERKPYAEEASELLQEALRRTFNG